MSTGKTMNIPVTTTNSYQPDKSWVVLDDQDGSVNITVPLGFGKIGHNVHTIRWVTDIRLKNQSI